jgi:membrane-associated phospholipid phosphatase
MKYIFLNLIALFGFVATYLALQNGYFLDIDSFISGFPREKLFIWLFFLITDVGGLVMISIGSIFLLVLLTIQAKYKKVLYSVVALLGGLILQTLIKNLLEVARPENSMIAYSGYSFPSGHTNMTTILFLSFCFYVFSDLVDKRRRKLYFAISFLIIFLVGISRVYLNAHWVSDVVAGWCLGVFWATVPLAIKNLKLKM